MSSGLVFIDDRSDDQSSLTVDINPDQIEWGYGLNTQVIPTYGGEVIQILSAYIENMTVSGQVRTYGKAEEIFKWFVQRIEKATQPGQFRHQKGIKMIYKAREWEFRVLPLSIGPLKYGRDIVAPEWSVNFHVVQPDQDMLAKVIDSAEEGLLADRLGLETGETIFGRATGNIGWEEDDPFRSPVEVNAQGEFKDEAYEKKYNRLYKAIIGGEDLPRYSTSDLGDWFNNLIPSYLQGDFDDLTTDYSRPIPGGQNQPQQQGNESNLGVQDMVKYVKERRGE
jgi:hypothetical protein